MQEFSRSLPMMLYRTRVLRVLWQHEQIAFRELADLTLIPPPSLVGVVDRLARSGLANRRRSDTDRRNVFVHATDKGQSLEAEVRPRVDEAYAELRRSVDAQTWDALIAGLERISSIDDEAAGKSAGQQAIEE
jgi:DNA-binding MarR family transcriptional regulator